MNETNPDEIEKNAKELSWNCMFETLREHYNDIDEIQDQIDDLITGLKKDRDILLLEATQLEKLIIAKATEKESKPQCINGVKLDISFGNRTVKGIPRNVPKKLKLFLVETFEKMITIKQMEHLISTNKNLDKKEVEKAMGINQSMKYTIERDLSYKKDTE